MSIAPPASVRRIAYLGSPDLAVRPLRALVDAGYEIPLVVSMPDRRRGRGNELMPTAIKAAAVDLGLRVTSDLADLVDLVENNGVDLAVVVAYGRIIPASLLQKLAFVNLHFSLLPRWRGAAPVERALLAGDRRTGVCLMDLDVELDTGALYRRTETEIEPDETLDELRDRLVEIGSAQLLGALEEGFGEPTPQEGDPVYAHKISVDERKIDWAQSASAIHRQVRVGGAFTTWQGKRFKIHRTRLTAGDGVLVVPTGSGELELLEVQPEGKPRMDAGAWANGARWRREDRFGA
ncbi:MAG: methionyl-tRNA formyltransferase [Acidimicrobiales bacterium]